MGDFNCRRITEPLQEIFRTRLNLPDGKLGAIGAVHTFGDYLNRLKSAPSYVMCLHDMTALRHACSLSDSDCAGRLNPPLDTDRLYNLFTDTCASPP
jgi:hypothetical protein